MKKTDVKDMIDGISDTYINEATRYAMQGSEKAEIPIFLTKRGLFAAASVCAAAAIIVGLIVRDALSEDILLPPSSSQSDTAQTNHVMQQIFLPSTTKSNITAASTKTNILGGSGELVPLGQADAYNVFLQDDDYYYIGLYDIYQGGASLQRCSRNPDDIGHDMGQSKDRITFPTATRTTLDLDIKLMTDGTSLFIEHDDALYKTDSYGNETILMDYADEQFRQGVQSLLDCGFNAYAVYSIADGVYYVFGRDAQYKNIVFPISETDRESITASGTSVEEIDSALLTPNKEKQYIYSFTDDSVWFFNQNGSLTQIDFSNMGYATYGFYDLSIQSIPLDMEHMGKSWYIYGENLFYIDYVDSKETLLCCKIENGGVTQVETAGSIERINYTDGVLYTLEATDAAHSPYPDIEMTWYTIRRYDLSDVFNTEPITVASDPFYGSNNEGQFSYSIGSQRGNADTIILSAGPNDFIVTDIASSVSPTLLQLKSETASAYPNPVDLIRFSSTNLKLRINYSEINQFTYFSPEYRIYNSDTGETLPCYSSQYPLTAQYYQASIENMIYPRAVYDGTYLYFNWSDAYGELSEGHYTLKLTVYDEEETPSEINVNFTIDSSEQIALSIPNNSEEKGIVAEIKDSTLTRDGCTLLLTNNTDNAWYYGQGYSLLMNRYLLSGEEREQPTHTEPYFNALGYELAAHSSTEIEINWSEFYEKLETYEDYQLVLWGTGYPPLSVFFSIT